MPLTCAVCGGPFEAIRPTARFCSGKCRKRHSRDPGVVVSVPVAAPPTRLLGSDGESVEGATRSELVAAGRLSTAEGRKALALARRLDSDRWESGMGLAAVTKEHSRLLAEALKGAAVAGDFVDDLQARRERKRHAG